MKKPSDLPISDADWNNVEALQVLVIALLKRVEKVEWLEERVAQLEQ